MGIDQRCRCHAGLQLGRFLQSREQVTAPLAAPLGPAGAGGRACLQALGGCLVRPRHGRCGPMTGARKRCVYRCWRCGGDLSCFSNQTVGSHTRLEEPRAGCSVLRRRRGGCSGSRDGAGRDLRARPARAPCGPQGPRQGEDGRSGGTKKGPAVPALRASVHRNCCGRRRFRPAGTGIAGTRYSPPCNYSLGAQEANFDGQPAFRPPALPVGNASPLNIFSTSSHGLCLAV